MQAFERERRASTVADESLDARPVLGLDAHGGVDAEATRALPVEHAGGIELVEESLTPEVAEDAFLDDGLHLSDAIGRQAMGLVKRDLTVVGVAEDTIEDDDVVVGVDVEWLGAPEVGGLGGRTDVHGRPDPAYARAR